jgi:uncharacterized protein YlxW (UPF0749 family)
MPGLAFIKTWKFWAILIVAGVIASTGYFAVKTYSKALKENTQLREDVRVAQAEKKALDDALRGINRAVDTNDTNTRTIVQRTQTIEREIHAAPVTTQCVDSPAISITLRRLREQNDRANQDPVSSQPVPVPAQP